MKKVSIIIPIYNCEEYLHDCFESIVNQTYKKELIEVILINDGTKDNSVEICKEYKKKYQWIFIDRKENKGLSYTRNEGIEKSNGKYIIFLDSDDLLYKDAVENLVKTIEETNSDIVVSKLNSFNSQGEYGYYSDKYLKNKKTFTLSENKKITNCISVCGKIYNKEIMNKTRFIENVAHEDNYFTLKLFLNAKNITTLPIYTYYRRIREGENPSIMQNLSYKTFKDLLTNFNHLLEENITTPYIYGFTLRKTINYIINNINKKEQKKCLNEIKKYVKKAYKKKQINNLILTYYNFIYSIYYIGAKTYKEIMNHAKKH